MKSPLEYRSYDIEMCRAMLIKNEAHKTNLYDDTNGKRVRLETGKITVGVGWNIDDKGLPTEVIKHLLDLGIAESEIALNALVPDWVQFNQARKLVMIDMAFNLGHSRLSQFKLMRGALRRFDWGEAAKQMIDSAWYKQVKGRAKRNVAAMRSGEVADLRIDLSVLEKLV